jgi:drug/metabolite transporter (DMT)-like permease
LGTLYPIGFLYSFTFHPNLAIGWPNLAIIAIGSLIFPIVNIVAFKANKDVDVGVYSIIANLMPVITIITAWGLLGDTLTPRQMLGAAILLFSSIIIMLPQLSHRSRSSVKGMLLAVLSTVLLGLGITYERFVLGRIDFGAYLVIGWGAQSLWMLALAWPERHKLKKLMGEGKWKRIYAYTLSTTFRSLCFITALRLAQNASLVSSAISFTAVMVVLAGYIYLKEKEWVWLKVGSALVGTAGLIILSS